MCIFAVSFIPIVCMDTVPIGNNQSYDFFPCCLWVAKSQKQDIHVCNYEEKIFRFMVSIMADFLIPEA